MISKPDLSGKLAIDAKGLAELRQSAQQNSPDALKAAAKQFEALFMNMMLKSMREASPQDSPFDSEQSKMYTAMLDQQLSQNLAKRGVGLADVLIRQLSSTVVNPSLDPSSSSVLDPIMNQAFASSPDALGLKTPSFVSPDVVLTKIRAGKQAPHVKAFQERLLSHAEEASRSTGIPAKFMLGQAALESGWGKHEIKAADGGTSHNLFGIKATSNWKGRVVEAATTEFVNGAMQTKMQKFRAYDSYADAFKDYAKLLKNNPRYEHVLANAQDVHGFAQGLQKAGYATDPHYAAKLTRIINHTLSA